MFLTERVHYNVHNQNPIVPLLRFRTSSPFGKVSQLMAHLYEAKRPDLQ